MQLRDMNFISPDFYLHTYTYICMNIYLSGMHIKSAYPTMNLNAVAHTDMSFISLRKWQVCNLSQLLPPVHSFPHSPSSIHLLTHLFICESIHLNELIYMQLLCRICSYAEHVRATYGLHACFHTHYSIPACNKISLLTLLSKFSRVHINTQTHPQTDILVHIYGCKCMQQMPKWRLQGVSKAKKVVEEIAVHIGQSEISLRVCWDSQGKQDYCIKKLKSTS